MMRTILITSCFVLLASLAESQIKSTIIKTETTKHTNTPPRFAQPLEEFRGAWIATVDNINWPSTPGLSTADQQKEALEILDKLHALNFNAVIFQVRPQADALYQSELEPWSYFLTGEQDKIPDPFYDPLIFWIEEAHKRGMELHAWLNPYRAHHFKGNSNSPRSVTQKNPELVVKLKEGYYWMDPSLKQTQDLTSSVVLDIIRRYDVDGIHFDDYFYPYPSYNGNEDFPDDSSWNSYQKAGGKLSRGDWRRDAVNTLIERLYKEIKAEKKHVKFGLSPFGIWKPGYPASIEGFDQHEKLYADAKLWLNKGWIDYFSPQLYWPTGKIAQSYPILLGWWQQENTHQRHLWPGINIGTDKNGIANNPEIISEIMIARAMVPKSAGVVHWHGGSVINNATLSKQLMEGIYKSPALVPASPWLTSSPPLNPFVAVAMTGDSVEISWTPRDNQVSRWVLYFKYQDKWENKILVQSASKSLLPAYRKEKNGDSIPLQLIMVTGINRVGMESEQHPVVISH
jgi:uncharacterized lipoprotein YddW (UPF0748 family)